MQQKEGNFRTYQKREKLQNVTKKMETSECSKKEGNFRMQQKEGNLKMQQKRGKLQDVAKKRETLECSRKNGNFTMQPKRLMSKSTLTFLLLMPVKVLLSCLRSQVLLLLVSPLLTSCCMLWTVLRHRSCDQGPWSRNKITLFVGNRILPKYFPRTCFANISRRISLSEFTIYTKSGPYSRILSQ